MEHVEQATAAPGESREVTSNWVLVKIPWNADPRLLLAELEQDGYEAELA